MLASDEHAAAPDAASSASPAAPSDDLRRPDGILKTIQESDYFSEKPEVMQLVSDHINAYFNQPLEMFPWWDVEAKPDRFHVMFARQIDERFPNDADLRGKIARYGRRVFNALRTHVAVKRLLQTLSLIAFAALAFLGPTVFAGWTHSPLIGLALAVGAMIVTFGLFWGSQSILFIQYKFRLENDTYALSRDIVQRTRELQNLFTTARAMSDQAETQYSQDGKAWGQRAMYLTRLTMWLGARVEYYEKFVQMELWRVRRERYWMRWFSRFTTPLITLIWAVVFLALRAPAGHEWEFRGLQLLAIALGVLVSAMSYFQWQTPTSALKDKLGVENWVRYASLDVDDAVADQVRRDKERLVEYRALTRGGR